MPGPGVVSSLADLPNLLRTADGFAEVMVSLRAGRAGTIDGTWGSSMALAVAALVAESPATVLVVLAHSGDVDAWANDLYTFANQKPFIFPALETWPAEKSPFDETPGKRLRAIQKLAVDPPRILLTTVAAIMQPVPGKDELEQQGRRIKVGETVDLDAMSHWLVESGYKRVDAVELVLLK